MNITPKVKTSSLRLLVLTPNADASSRLPVISAFLTKLTSSKPSADLNSFAGYTSHAPLNLKTRYYEAEVPIWCDELPLSEVECVQVEKGVTESTITIELTEDESSSSNRTTKSTSSPTIQQENDITTTLSEWQDQMLSPSAHEVRQVIGSIILILPFSTALTTNTIQTIQQAPQRVSYIETVTALRDAIEDETGREVASVLVLQDMSPATANASHTNKAQKTPETVLENLEDECLGTHGIIGWDFVSWRPDNNSSASTSDSKLSTPISSSTRNEFGEKTGFERVVEVLERTDWFASSSTPDDEEIDHEYDDEISFNNIRNKHDTLDFLNFDSEPFTSSSTLGSDLQREIMGLKMSMLDRESSTIPDDVETDQSIPQTNDAFDDDDDDGFDFKPAPQSRNTDRKGEVEVDDVWTSLDAKDNNGNKNDDRDENKKKSDTEYEDENNTTTSSVSNPDPSALQSLLTRVLAVREKASTLPPSERRKFAKREVERIMRDL